MTTNDGSDGLLLLSSGGSKDDQAGIRQPASPYTPGAPKKTPPPAGVKPPLFRALSAFGAGDAGETDLREGEVVVVLDVEAGSGWWKVQSEAGVGWVPDHFLRPLPSDDNDDGSLGNNADTDPLVFYGKEKDFLKPKLPMHKKEKPKRPGHVANRFLKPFDEDEGSRPTTNFSPPSAESVASTPPTPPTRPKRNVKDLLSRFNQA